MGHKRYLDDAYKRYSHEFLMGKYNAAMRSISIFQTHHKEPRQAVTQILKEMNLDDDLVEQLADRLSPLLNIAPTQPEPKPQPIKMIPWKLPERPRHKRISMQKVAEYQNKGWKIYFQFSDHSSFTVAACFWERRFGSLLLGLCREEKDRTTTSRKQSLSSLRNPKQVLSTQQKRRQIKV